MRDFLSLNERDQRVLWHPFTQYGANPELLPIMGGQGSLLKLYDGRVVIDAISSWWVNLHGHAQPTIAQAIYDQSHQLEHALFTGFTHKPAIILAEMLVDAVQERGTHLSRCFFSDNGSTAVEVAMKIAYHFYKNQGITTRNRFISLANGFHGNTLGSLALSAAQTYQNPITDCIPPVDFIASEDIASLEYYFNQRANDYAALIIEPMIQGFGGMRIHSANFLAKVADLCKQAGVLLICDEAFTGFYRTGTCFAFEHAHIKPDLLCLAKGLTGGFLPLAVTLTTEEIFNTFSSPTTNRTLFHGHSYTANPLACAAGIASWRLLHQLETQLAIQRISIRTQAWMEHLSSHPACEFARCLGTIGALNIRGHIDNIEQKAQDYALDRHVLLRPIGSVLYAVPPYCVTDDEIDIIYSTMGAILSGIQ